MGTPRIEIDINKIIHNTQFLVHLYGKKNIQISGVTKAVSGNPTIAKALIKGGINILADSRILNLEKLKNARIIADFVLIRSPLLSEVTQVVALAGTSLNTELIIIEKLSEQALASNVVHKIILMIELGDLREGIPPSEIDAIIVKVLELKGVLLIGVGTNLACLGGVSPDSRSMRRLSDLSRRIETKFNLSLQWVSGGNSANYNWFASSADVGRINNIRLGESIYLGRESLNQRPIPNLFTDAFTIVAEVIESKIKSFKFNPVGKAGAKNKSMSLSNARLIKRSLLAIGNLDTNIDGLTPKSDFEIVGATSDHMVIKSHSKDLEVGEEVRFSPNYAALARTMNSSFVAKEFI